MRTLIAAASCLALTACIASEPQKQQPDAASISSQASSLFQDSSVSSVERVLTPAEKAGHLKRTANIMAGMKMPTPGPGDVACISDVLGIRFYHPESWGSCACAVTSGFPDGFAAECTFPRSVFHLGAISRDYKDEYGGRGLTTTEVIARSDPERWDDVEFYDEDISPQVRRVLKADKEMQIWNDWPVGWDTGDYVFAFRAPTKHSSVTIIGAVGPLANSADTSEKDVRDFLLAAYTYELLP